MEKNSWTEVLIPETFPSALLPSGACVPVPAGVSIKEVAHESKGTKGWKEGVGTRNKGYGNYSEEGLQLCCNHALREYLARLPWVLRAQVSEG